MIVFITDFLLAIPNRKLVFLYLANDVIQNSKKKGPEYGESFCSILAKAFKDIAQRCEDEKTFRSLDRILKIWDERGVYESDKIKEFYENLKSNPKTANILKPSAPPVDIVKTSPAKKRDETSTRKRKTDESSGSTTNGNSDKKKPKPTAPTTSASKAVKAITLEVNGKVETHVTLSPQHTVVEGDPPEPEELIKMFTDLEEAASSDAATREKITKLPPEVSDLEALTKLEDKEAAIKLSKKVNDAVQLLKDYNTRLANEMTERNKLTVMLKDFQREQQELLVQAEQRLEVSFC